MARFVQTTAENVEAALRIADQLIQQGYHKGELNFVVAENLSEDAAILQNEGIEVHYINTEVEASWKEAEETVGLDTPADTGSDTTLDAYKNDIDNGRILIVIDSKRTL